MTGAVTLVAHLPRYRHAARALAEAGLLHRYITAPWSSRPLPGVGLPLVGPSIARFNRSRVFPELRGLSGRRLWLGQAGARVAGLTLGRWAPEDALPAQSWAWDVNARLHLGGGEVLHVIAGIAQRTASAAKARGALVVCDVRSAHPDALREATVPALARRGIIYHPWNERNIGRLESEYRLADLLICNSNYTRQTFLEAGFDDSRLVAVPLGCDPNEFTMPRHRPHRFTILFVGRERVGKGFADLAEALAALPPSSRLLVSGDPDAPTARLLAGVRCEIEFLGEVPPSRMPGVYHRASVLVLPSLCDGFGLVVPEAMASGLPVIVSDRTGAAEIVKDRRSGYVVPAADPESLADRLATLERDPDLVASMGEAAREEALSYSWSSYGERLVGVYREVLG